MNEQHAVKQPTEVVNQSRPWGITIVAVLMILFGLAEVVTGFTHNFYDTGTSTSPSLPQAEKCSPSGFCTRPVQV